MFGIDINWLGWFQGLFRGVGWFSLGGIVIIAICAYFLGVKTVLETISEFLKPVLKGLGDGIVGFARILGKGIKDIFDDWVTIVTVATAALVLYVSLDIKHEIRDKELTGSLKSCQVELQKLRKSIPKIPKELLNLGKKQTQTPDWWPF